MKTKKSVKMNFRILALRFLVLVILLPITYQASSQQLNCGFRVGVGTFNQNWKFDNLPFSGWRNEKAGITTFVFGELNHNNHFGTKLELGYLKKGYYNDLSSKGPNGIIYNERSSFTADFNTFYLGLSERITFFKSNLRPYIKMGANLQLIPKGEIENHNLIVVDKTQELLMFKADWTNLTYNANLGIGLTYKELLFMEIEYSPSITPLVDMEHTTVHDRYFALSVGLNINGLYKKD